MWYLMSAGDLGEKEPFRVPRSAAEVLLEHGCPETGGWALLLTLPLVPLVPLAPASP